MNNKTERLYINITNQCNSDCEFCCMGSCKENDIYLDFETYKKIVDQHINDFDLFELQLEGGEPLLSSNLYLFIHYAVCTNKCSKIIIATNGILLDDHLQRLIDFSSYSNTEILIKPSINYWLLNKNENLVKHLASLYTATEFIPNFDMRFNVRVRKEDNELIKSLKKHKIYDFCNIYELQSYGKWKEKVEYGKPVICQNVDDWNVFSCDGTCFGTDLLARSEYECNLSMEGK